jgi:hypothetical protein
MIWEVSMKSGDFIHRTSYIWVGEIKNPDNSLMTGIGMEISCVVCRSLSFWENVDVNHW